MKNPKLLREEQKLDILATLYPEAYEMAMASNRTSALAPRSPAGQGLNNKLGANRGAMRPNPRPQNRDICDDRGPKPMETIFSSETLFRFCALL